MSFDNLPVHLQHRITWLFRQNLWTHRQVPRNNVVRVMGARDTWYSETVSFRLNDTKSMEINRRGNPRRLFVDASHVCTEVEVFAENGVALVCKCCECDQSVVVSLHCCHTRKSNTIEETEDATRTELLTSQRSEVYNGQVSVVDSSTQRLEAPLGSNPAHRYKIATKTLGHVAR